MLKTLRRYHFAAIGATVLTVALGGSALATPPLPYTMHREQNIDNHQVGYLDARIDPDGTVVVVAKFSNGKQIAGNTFAVETALMTTNNTPLFVIRQTKGLDGSWGGHAREGQVVTTFKMTPDQLRQFDHVEVSQMRALNDGITPDTWEKIWVVADTLIKIITEGDQAKKSSGTNVPSIRERHPVY
jgi:hypothetical protein